MLWMFCQISVRSKFILAAVGLFKLKKIYETLNRKTRNCNCHCHKNLAGFVLLQVGQPSIIDII
jgi:hypothetical protein